MLKQLSEKKEYALPTKGASCKLLCVKGLDVNFWDTPEGKTIFDQLYALTRLGFVQEDSPVLWKDTENHIFGSEFLFVVSNNDQVISYAVLDFWKQETQSVLYLSGIMVHPQYQGTNVSSNTLRNALGQFNPDFIAARTQNPVMYESLARICKAVYPNHLGHSIPPEVKLIGEFTAKCKLRMKDYDPDSMVGKGIYGGCMYGKEPSSRDPLIEKWFKEMVSLKRGDAMIVVGAS